jgi:hypothetical protein
LLATVSRIWAPLCTASVLAGGKFILAPTTPLASAASWVAGGPLVRKL